MTVTRLVLLGCSVAVIAGAAAIAAVWPDGGEPAVISGVQPMRFTPQLRDGSGAVRIPGMVKWISSRSAVCTPGKGAAGSVRLPQWCYEVKATGSLFQQWTTNRKSPDESPGASVTVLRLQTYQQAELLLHTLDYPGISATGFTPLPQAAVNGGLAGQLEEYPGRTQLRFEWVAGNHIVEVNVWGRGRVRLDQAQAIARTVRPSA
jgi:hypothetical protein